MTAEGLSYVLTRAIGVTDSQLLEILRPFGGNFPNTQAQIQQVVGNL